MKFEIREREEIRCNYSPFYGTIDSTWVKTVYDVYKDSNDFVSVYIQSDGSTTIENNFKLVKSFDDLLDAAKYKSELEKLLG